MISYHCRQLTITNHFLEWDDAGVVAEKGLGFYGWSRMVSNWPGLVR
ncbi:hypothetical protein ACFQ4A_09420 [Lentibacillus salinarum]|uniref:Uncharacterized protein n=1 Tax=Lentibacillus salinarum TaxID=446820 RepID=A0ABW3ZU50_9BACI